VIGAKLKKCHLTLTTTNWYDLSFLG